MATSVLGTLVATGRACRARPAVALVEAMTGVRHTRAVRTSAGEVLVLGGVVGSVALATVAAEQAAGAAFVVMLAECIGVGLLGPALLGAVVARRVP